MWARYDVRSSDSDDVVVTSFQTSSLGSDALSITAQFVSQSPSSISSPLKPSIQAALLQSAVAYTKAAPSYEMSEAGFPSNVRNVTDGTDATTDEASDSPFDTPSFTINIKLFAVCFF